MQRLRNIPSGNYYAPSPEEARNLHKAICEYRPSVILAQVGNRALRVLPVAMDAGVPVVAHFHGSDISAGLRNRWYRESLRRNVRNFDACVVVADYQRDALVDLGSDPRRIHVIPCGVPVDQVQVATQRDTQPCRFVSVGRFTEKKAPLHLVRAFAACLRNQPDTRLTMIGDGPLLTSCRQLSEELNLGSKICFLGALPPHEVTGTLADSSVFLQHSVTAPDGDKEGWPVSVAEAMAAGLPVIATRHAGIEQQVADGITGFLVAEHEWNGMSKKMVTLARDPDLRNQFGKKGREVALGCFDQSLMIGRLEQVLLQAMSFREMQPDCEPAV